MTEQPKIVCIKCIHYQVTWEPANPYGCKAYGFKTQQVPSALVQRISGMPCQQFELKPEKTRSTD